MQQIALLVFLVGSLLQLSALNYTQPPTYGHAICSGTICAQISAFGGSSIQCIPDPESLNVTNITVLPFSETYVEAPGGITITAWVDVAINPLDGTIYVMYQTGGTTAKLGTIEDPLAVPAPISFEVTPIGNLTQEEYTGMTFDCEGNLYGVSEAALPSVYQFDYNSDTIIDTVINTLNTCGGDLECTESLFYNFQDEIFYRISSANSAQDLFFTRVTINGTDMPSNGTTITPNTEGCDYGSLTYKAAFYIGNERSIISCINDAQIYLLSGTTGSPMVTIIPNSGLDGGADGLWNYFDNGNICKPPSCTKYPTQYPTEYPTIESYLPTFVPTISPLKRGKGKGKSKGAKGGKSKGAKRGKSKGKGGKRGKRGKSRK